jgi:uncharacterized protein
MATKSVDLAADNEMSEEISRHPTVEEISFPGDDARLAGRLHLPSPETNAVPLSAAVVTGTWTSVKEQMADRYAAKLAERGVVGLSFDFTRFGASGGEPREVESPGLKARDIGHAVSFLSTHRSVDPDRIGALAICASAGYAVSDAVADPRLRAMALVAPWLHDADLLREVYGGEDGVSQRIRAGEAAQDRYDLSGVVEYVPVMDADDPRAAMPMAIDFYRNPARGGIPGWPNRFAVMAWPEWLRFDPIALAPRVIAPTLVVHSEDAAIPDGARRFYAGLTCEKEIAWIQGSQYDFYDQEPTVTQAVDMSVAHFERHLARRHDGGPER